MSKIKIFLLSVLLAAPCFSAFSMMRRRVRQSGAVRAARQRNNINREKKG